MRSNGTISPLYLALGQLLSSRPPQHFACVTSSVLAISALLHALSRLLSACRF